MPPPPWLRYWNKLLTDVVDKAGAAGETRRQVSKVVGAADRVIGLSVGRARALNVALLVNDESVNNQHQPNYFCTSTCADSLSRGQ